MNSLQCPSCKSTEHHREDENRYQCDRCHWRFQVDDLGNPHDLLPWRTAGRKRKRKNLKKR